MNYREIYEQARALTNAWKADDPETEVMFQDRIESEERKLPNRDAFIPTGYERLDAVILAHKPRILYRLSDEEKDAADGTWSAAFKPAENVIVTGAPAAFKSRAAYGRTLAHELSHWTQLPLERNSFIPLSAGSGIDPNALAFGWNVFGILPPWIYGMEELIAESMAHRIIEWADIPASEYSLQYIRAWIDNIEKDFGHPMPEAMLHNAAKLASEGLAFLRVPE